MFQSVEAIAGCRFQMIPCKNNSDTQQRSNLTCLHFLSVDELQGSGLQILILCLVFDLGLLKSRRLLNAALGTQL